MLEDNSQCPQWILGLLTEKFFNACLIHEDLKKNEKNIFCLDCCEGICAHCSQVHHSHRLLQIRRYVYHDVLRLGDAEKLMDCAYVQSYTTNSAKVVFLNQRPQTRPSRGSGNICTTCDRALQDPYFFCSLSCKVHKYLCNTKEYVFFFRFLIPTQFIFSNFPISAPPLFFFFFF
ncbi:zinc ion binding [Olea europaea subsp. europaea]|uniref:Zinc ion binding n=1 Tax=Olea europaea subsp. europaea TaxID=158383 RepID=A0A8S0VF12_OLEEU|nr:zinc ion binding [Olea europaea subsp. europaea]